jgi:hypothetical protein
MKYPFTAGPLTEIIDYYCFLILTERSKYVCKSYHLENIPIVCVNV